MHLSSKRASPFHIEAELADFLQTEGLMTPALRLLTARELFFFLYDPAHPGAGAIEALAQPYPNWYQLLARLMREEGLRRLTAHHEEFAFSVARETLVWCQRTYAQYQAQYIDQQETAQLAYLQAHGHELTIEQWRNQIDRLQDAYPEEALAWDFYRDSLTRDPDPQSLPILRQNILSDWARLLHAKQNSLEGSFLEESFTDYFAELQQKARQLEAWGDNLAPFYNFVGMLWSDALGNWTKIPWDKLEQYARRLQRDPHLRELADLLGRWQQQQLEAQREQVLEARSATVWKPSRYGKSEIVGIHHSADLSAIMPSEVALLCYGETEALFAQKYVEKKLLTFQYRAETRQPETREAVTYQSVEAGVPGPFILCIDTSGSMFGIPERIAKALALAILEIALRQRRRAYLISFSSGIQTTEMTGMEQDLAAMIDFLGMSFHGGTDLQPALLRALDMVQTEAYRQADVLVISDFIIPRLDRRTYDRIQEARTDLGVGFHSLYITRRPDPAQVPLPIFDHHWVYDLDDPKVLRQTMAYLRELEGA
ncbi:MAG: hypothetical protein OHK0039_04040 [Bacteroidia bacterium]